MSHPDTVIYNQKKKIVICVQGRMSHPDTDRKMKFLYCNFYSNTLYGHVLLPKQKHNRQQLLEESININIHFEILASTLISILKKLQQNQDFLLRPNQESIVVSLSSRGWAKQYFQLKSNSCLSEADSSTHCT